MLLQYFIIVISRDTLYHDVKDDSVRIMCVSLASVSINCLYLLETSSALKGDSVGQSSLGKCEL
jgi:hypothetical protein